MAVQAHLPPSAMSFFVLLQVLASLSLPALASNPGFSSDQLILSTVSGLQPNSEERQMHRSQFPKDFIFGVGNSAFQVEGAVSEGGKGVSIWDTFSHIPGTIRNGETADVATDHYHRYEEDIDLVADMNMDSFKLSISWTRIFPMGTQLTFTPGSSFLRLKRRHDGTGRLVNPEGVAHYNRVIDAAMKRGLIPFVTLFHWDLPEALQDAYGGWASYQIVADFAAYAEACFAAFGDRVKHWVTLNEPNFLIRGYGFGNKSAPGRTSHPSTEPYIAAHNVLLAHAAAVDVYRRLFKAEQKGETYMTVEVDWGQPLTNSTEDIEAVDRYLAFQVGWFLDPLFFGDYPAIMRKCVGDRLPQFSPDEVSLVKGSLDFITINHYTTHWVTTGPGPTGDEEPTVGLDQRVSTISSNDGVEIGPTASSWWLSIVPRGMYSILKWAYERYNVPIFISENGMDIEDSPMEESIHDPARIKFFYDYLSSLLQAVREGVDVRGFFAWSLTDSFEWGDGYKNKFGLVYVDFKDNLTRYPRDSARWFSQVLQRRLDS